MLTNIYSNRGVLMNHPVTSSGVSQDRGAEREVLSPAKCPCCDSSTTTTIYRVSSIPVHSCILLDSAEEAKAFPRGDLNIVFCSSCGFLFNAHFDKTVMSYAGNFEESQHFSETFSTFAKGLAAQVAQRCAISGKHVLEIGCGKGEFLRELCRIGNATGLGIDPGYRADPGRGSDADRVRFLAEYFKEDSQIDADVVLCRHTLEHIASVRDFVRSIRKGIGARNESSVVFETPDVKRVLQEGAFWDMYYEHCSYFSPGAHARLFRQQDFDITDLSLEYDNQYIIQYASPSSSYTEPCFALEEDLSEMQVLADNYRKLVTNVQDNWRERVCAAWAEGRNVVLWGGGSKGVSFLTTLNLSSEVSAVVDVNPFKQGKFMPGTGHRVIAPAALVDEAPHIVIVMNPIYVAEITKMLKSLGLEPEIAAVGNCPPSDFLGRGAA